MHIIFFVELGRPTGSPESTVPFPVRSTSVVQRELLDWNTQIQLISLVLRLLKVGEIIRIISDEVLITSPGIFSPFELFVVSGTILILGVFVRMYGILHQALLIPKLLMFGLRVLIFLAISLIRILVLDLFSQGEHLLQWTKVRLSIELITRQECSDGGYLMSSVDILSGLRTGGHLGVRRPHGSRYFHK